ncbi:antibiotic biosynthesis monooxygenase [Streptosporangiaceae bacterium NEAU-GS5]|nr:antibiotic biosynthesis monooxygenase [Streptosporangiaceae bacterium NEAU-GS5]
MIARIWTAAATAEGAAAYVEHFQKRVQPELQSLAGHRGAYLLQRQTENRVDIQVITLWASLDAIRDFAGPDLETAVVEPEAQAVLLTYSRTVTHHDVVVDTI